MTAAAQMAAALRQLAMNGNMTNNNNSVQGNVLPNRRISALPQQQQCQNIDSNPATNNKEFNSNLFNAANTQKLQQQLSEFQARAQMDSHNNNNDSSKSRQANLIEDVIRQQELQLYLDKSQENAVIAKARADPRPFKCTFPNCDKAFKEKKVLRKHLLTHQPKRFHCAYPGCHKSFYERAKLKRHNLVHTGEKNFVCNFEGCNKRFALKANLQTHYRVHSGDRPYPCPFPGCNKRFTQTSGRNSHYKTHLHQRKRNHSESSSGSNPETDDLSDDGSSIMDSSSSPRDEYINKKENLVNLITTPNNQQLAHPNPESKPSSLRERKLGNGFVPPAPVDTRPHKMQRTGDFIMAPRNSHMQDNQTLNPSPQSLAAAAAAAAAATTSANNNSGGPLTAQSPLQGMHQNFYQGIFSPSATNAELLAQAAKYGDAAKAAAQQAAFFQAAAAAAAAREQEQQQKQMMLQRQSSAYSTPTHSMIGSPVHNAGDITPPVFPMQPGNEAPSTAFRPNVSSPMAVAYGNLGMDARAIEQFLLNNSGNMQQTSKSAAPNLMSMANSLQREVSCSSSPSSSATSATSNTPQLPPMNFDDDKAQQLFFSMLQKHQQQSQIGGAAPSPSWEQMLRKQWQPSGNMNCF